MAGGARADFWDALPREIFALLNAFADVEMERFKAAQWSAWQNARFIRHGTPDFEKMKASLSDAPAPELTEEQAAHNLRLWAAALAPITQASLQES